MNTPSSKDFQVLAKSKPEISLEQHIEDCLDILKQLMLCFPNLPFHEHQSFWDLLFYCIVFHDTGKAHPGFQGILYGLSESKAGKWNNQRHELFSLYFIQQSKLPDIYKRQVYYVVGGHHKSADEILQNTIRFYDKSYGGFTHSDGSLSFEEECNKLWKNKIWKILNKYGLFQENEDTIDLLVTVRNMYGISYQLSHPAYIRNMMLVGFMKQCDHLASAGVKRLYRLSDADFSFLFKYPLYTHQQTSYKSLGNVILSSPTGSGKTETSILWLKHQLEVEGEGRIFYVLPYTASINAMYERLNPKFSKQEHYVGMLHGRLLQYIESKMSSDKDKPCTEDEKKQLIEDFKTLVTPMKIVTPFQLLKHIFGLKGFEKGISEWSGGYFIFDEIHAYDSITFAQIIVLMEFCNRFLGVKFFIMTATLPSFMLEILKNAIGKHTRVVADEELYNAFDRHRVVIENGRLQDSLEVIQKELDAGRKVLVVCNTVEQAQHVYHELVSDSKLLLHGSFNAEDRNEKEERLQNENIKLLVGTQAIEVSLDIDYDTIYTEPAPLDALIQRFGRVNRKREKKVCICHVFDTSNDKDKFIYDKVIVARTLTVLSNIIEKQSGYVHEKDLQQLIDIVYPAWEEKQKNDFEITYQMLSKGILTQLSPLVYNEKSEEYFYQQFDGIKVLPVSLRKCYQDYLDTHQFIKADGLLVSIRESRLYNLLKEGCIDNETFFYETNQEKPLDSKNIRVIMRKYNKELGLQINETERIVDQFII